MAKALMLQGTGSDAGKSVLTAALCRILLDDGLRVAPFKAQNMSLNSFVTRDGLEMGRAQVVQAQAARLDPEVRMNPVLLKPSSEVGSQVIVMGRPVANMKVAEYHAYKAQAQAAAHRAYNELAAEYEVIVLEGAGSPGEINLKAHDFVNMAMARHARASVLLVGDIERGGIFASLLGHFELMEPWERELLAGYVINRFRGDASLLDSGLEFIANRTGRPVFGVLPYLADLGLPQEDSVSFKKGLYKKKATGAAQLDLALIDLPHISNFTDLEPLLAEPDIGLRLVRRGAELGNPDAIILPGSKNVIADLAFLQQSELAAAIRQAAGNCEIVGICGGFQMLGETVADPHGLESAGDTVAGLGLLPLSTRLAPDKTLVRRHFTHLPSGLPVHGYEIHHGRTEGNWGQTPIFCPEPAEGNSAAENWGQTPISPGQSPSSAPNDGPEHGAATPDGLIWGSYLHGIFDADPFRRWFIDNLRRRRGLPPLGRVVAPYDLEHGLCPPGRHRPRLPGYETNLPAFGVIAVLDPVFLLIAAFLLDAALGDPPHLPHPVRLMGWLINRLEKVLRVVLAHRLRLAGIILTTLVVGGSWLAGAALCQLAAAAPPGWPAWLAAGVMIYLAATTLANRELLRRVQEVLRCRELTEARRLVGQLVGRDTAQLDAAGVRRAALETLAENAADGIVAPLFYLALGGLPLALAYKAVNTLDSMVGYRHEKYRQLGWAAARLDDLANYLPARLTGVLIVLAAGLVNSRASPAEGRATQETGGEQANRQRGGHNGASHNETDRNGAGHNEAGHNGTDRHGADRRWQRVSGAWRIMRRDRRHHASPNSGVPEAALAGALGVRLGGPASYFGHLQDKPYIGDGPTAIAPEVADQARRIIRLSAILALAVMVAISLLLAQWGLPYLLPTTFW
ncbi:MAG: cobyric acid synthase [Desulfurivibrio sp.]|nr:cobyric acid synthase [Desulfurivibrio sp.]